VTTILVSVSRKDDEGLVWFFSDLGLMDFDDCIVIHIVKFLRPSEAVRVFKHVSMEVRRSFVRVADPGLWRQPSLVSLRDEEIVNEVKFRLKSDRSNVIDDLFLFSWLDPGRLSSLTAPNDDSILHMLCRNGDLGLVRMIANRIPALDVNVPGAGGMTCLHCAAFSRDLSLSSYLVSRGADPGIRDSIGRLAEDWATLRGAHQVASFLRKCRKGKV
jgi:hypothetical protein